jgi:hypothetical protein
LDAAGSCRMLAGRTERSDTSNARYPKIAGAGSLLYRGGTKVAKFASR